MADKHEGMIVYRTLRFQTRESITLQLQNNLSFSVLSTVCQYLSDYISPCIKVVKFVDTLLTKEGGGLWGFFLKDKYPLLYRTHYQYLLVL